MFLIIVVLITQAVGEVIQLSKGDHYTTILDRDDYIVKNECEDQVQLNLFTNQKMTQTLEFDDIVQVLYYPSEFNIILMLQTSGYLGILYTQSPSQLSEFKIHKFLSLNTQGVQGFRCTDITQATVSSFIAVCQDKDSYLYVSEVNCDYNSFQSTCTSKLYQLTKSESQCNFYSVITQSSWRQEDPYFFSVYCYLSNEVLPSLYLKQANGVQQLYLPFKKVQKISFFDQITLIILDRQQGLFVVRLFYYEDEGEFDYQILSQQLFLENEIYYAMAYSLEQSAIRFPPSGVVENDINYSLVIVTNLYLYEIVLPSSSDNFYNLKLPVNDKILLKPRSISLQQGMQIKSAEIQYDEQFYYLCIYTQQSECIRIKRHDFNDEYVPKLLLLNSYHAPLILSYPVSYSPLVGQTNIVIVQPVSGKTLLTLIKNEIERSIIKYKVEQGICSILYYQKDQLIKNHTIYGEILNEPNIISIFQNVIYNFPTTVQNIFINTLVKGPDPQLVFNDIENENIEVQSYSGYRFEMGDEIKKFIIEQSRIEPITFYDEDFRITFIQLEQVILILQKEEPESDNFTISAIETNCTFSNDIKQIIGISPYYFIFYKNSEIVNRIQIQNVDYIYQKDVNFMVDCRTYHLPLLKDLEYDVFYDIGFLNIFISTNTYLYYTDIDLSKLYTIKTTRKYRQMNIKFIKNNLLLGTYSNQLYLIELLNPYNSGEINIMERLIDLSITLSDSFKFFIVFIKGPIPFLIIIDQQQILVYTINNLQFDVTFDSTIPTFGAHIQCDQVWLMYHSLIVGVKGGEYRIYDLTRTGSDRLLSIQRETWQGIREVYVSYPTNKRFQYCIYQILEVEIICYFNKVIQFRLKNNNPEDINNNFNVQIVASSSLQNSNSIQFNLIGSFMYQDTIITISKQNSVYDIYKTENQSKIPISKYFQGPVFQYNIQGQHQDQFKISSFIQSNDLNYVKIDTNQRVLGATASKEYLIIMGEASIQMLNIALTQYTHNANINEMTYQEINQVFLDNFQPMIMYCSKAYLNDLIIAEFTSIHIIAFVCQTVIEGVLKSNEINELVFTIIADSQPIHTQFLQNMFFLNVDKQEYIYQKRSALLLDSIKMINFPISFHPYQFITVTALVKENKIYQLDQDDKMKDSIICIIIGHFNQAKNNFLYGSLVDEIGAQNFNQDTLIVNNLQMECLSGCNLSTTLELDSKIELVFNDQYFFNLYRIQISLKFYSDLTYDYTLLDTFIINLKQQQINGIQYSSYIDTKVQNNQSFYFANVTTDTISFDLVIGDGHNKVEQIFKSYTSCKSPSGSLSASQNEYFAMSCRNESQYLDQQTQFVKLFIRDPNSSHISVVEAIQINGSLKLLDIYRSLNPQKTQLLILEMVNQELFQMRWFDLQSEFYILTNDDTPQEEMNIKLCASNLQQDEDQNVLQYQCSDIPISNVGYSQYIMRELMLFSLLLILPLILSIICIIYGITMYKKEKQRRIELFESKLEEQLKGQNYNIQSLNQYIEQ